MRRHTARWLPILFILGNSWGPVPAEAEVQPAETSDPASQDRRIWPHAAGADTFRESAATARPFAAVTCWNDRVLELCVKHRRNPLRVARALAVLHVAIDDAVALTAAEGGDVKAQEVAAGAAAGPVVDFLFPLESPGRFEALAWTLYAEAAAESEAHPGALANAWSLGQQAAHTTIAHALRDGSDLVWNPLQRPAPAPGIWRAAPPLNTYDPLEPLAGNWATWILKNGDEVQPPPPVSYDTPAYWREAGEVLAVSRALTPEQKQSAEEWNLDRGSVTPAGVWNIKSRELIRDSRLGTAETARVLAVLNIAMADATIGSWRTKYTYWTQRPVTAIRERLDPDWLPHVLTPVFPSYVSTHAAVSGAAAEVLAAFFPEATESLDAAAQEAAMSRLYGGIHFRSDNDEGLKLGHRIGRLVLKRIYGNDPVQPLVPKAIPSLLAPVEIERNQRNPVHGCGGGVRGSDSPQYLS